MPLIFGTPAPLFGALSKVNPSFTFRSVAGRYILLAFLPHPGPERDRALRIVRDNLGELHDEQRMCFGILPDLASFEAAEDDPPLRWFADPDGEIRGLYQAVDDAGEVSPCWVVLDPSLRVLGTAPISEGEETLAAFIRLGAPEAHAGVPLSAPVLIVPRVFERDFCRQLIGHYESQGGVASGVMRLRNGKTVGELDDFKRRKDAMIGDEALQAQIKLRLARRLVPEMEKAFGWRATRIERYVVACYSAEDGGYFRPHVDNNTPGTLHRKFACSINLNAEDFEGGDLRFPEFGPRTYRPPTGGAVVFSCSLLHEARPVTRGLRYACLPFFYDDEGARIREQNLHTFEPAAAD